MNTRLLSACVLLLSSLGTLWADQIVIPGAFATTEAPTGQNTLIRDAGNPRTVQMQIAASQLASMPVGSVISGVRWRLGGGIASWPASTATWADYEITLAQAANPIASMSFTFADNMLNPVMVRDGALSFAANSFGGGMTPNPWGPLVQFQSSYTYAGGDLVVLFRHTGSDLTDTVFLDAVQRSAVDGYNAVASTSFGLPSGGISAFAITQLEYSVPSSVPEPAAVSTFAGALGLAAFLRLRRR